MIGVGESSRQTEQTRLLAPQPEWRVQVGEFALGNRRQSVREIRVKKPAWWNEIFKRVCLGCEKNGGQANVRALSGRVKTKADIVNGSGGAKKSNFWRRVVQTEQEL